MNAFCYLKVSEVLMTETIKSIPLDELHPFPDHPFGVRDDEAMQQTVESVKEYGVIVPAMIARWMSIAATAAISCWLPLISSSPKRCVKA